MKKRWRNQEYIKNILQIQSIRKQHYYAILMLFYVLCISTNISFQSFCMITVVTSLKEAATRTNLCKRDHSVSQQSHRSCSLGKRLALCFWLQRQVKGCLAQHPLPVQRPVLRERIQETRWLKLSRSLVDSTNFLKRAD